MREHGKNLTLAVLAIALVSSLLGNVAQWWTNSVQNAALALAAEKVVDARQEAAKQKNIRSLVQANYDALKERHRYLRAGGPAIERLLVQRYNRTPAKAEHYAKLIIQEAQRYRLDPWLLVQIGHQESRWRAQSVSHAGAIGLMQIHARTWVGELPFVEARDDLWRPETNIRAGAAVLRHYLDRFDGDYHAALEAYNGGPGCVGRCTQTAVYRTEVWSAYQQRRRL